MNAGRLLLLAPVLALVLVACGGGSDSPDATRTPTLTSTPAGFLTRFTPTPAPTDPPGMRQGDAGKCPPLPAAACAQPGETVNIFQGSSLNRASALRLSRYSRPYAWVLDRERLQTLLRMFDGETYLFQYDILPLSDADHMRLELFWPPGEGIPWSGGTALDSVEFMIDAGPGLIGQGVIGLQWEMPPGFLNSLLASLSDVTPTPLPRTPFLTPTPTATVLPPRAVFFDQPAGRLDWDGPDSRVWSSDYSHCSNGQIIADFGVPGNISVEPDQGFWAIDILRPSADWHWTGYSHGDWQIWQGDDPDLAYLMHMPASRIAFAYRSGLCD